MNYRSVITVGAIVVIAVLFCTVGAVFPAQATTSSSKVTIDIDTGVISGTGFTPDVNLHINQVAADKKSKSQYDMTVSKSGIFKITLDSVSTSDTISISQAEKTIKNISVPYVFAYVKWGIPYTEKNAYVIPGSGLVVLGPANEMVTVTVKKLAFGGGEGKVSRKLDKNGEIYVWLDPHDNTGWNFSMDSSGQLSYTDKSGNIFTRTLVIPWFKEVGPFHWAYSAVQSLAKKEIIDGYPDKQFKSMLPRSYGSVTASITRAELAKIIVKALNIVEGTGTVGSFSDVPSTYWASPYMRIVSSQGVMQGYWDVSSFEFRPGLPLTRAEFACILVRMAGLEDEVDTYKDKKTHFTDDSVIKNWARGYVNVATQHNLLKGYPDNTFASTQNVTRVQAAQAIYVFKN